MKQLTLDRSDYERWLVIIAEKRAVYVPQDGGQSFYQECVSAEQATKLVERSRANCFDVERYGWVIVTPEDDALVCRG